MPRIANRSLGFVCGLLLLGAGLGGCASVPPDWTFIDASGARVSLSDYRGRVMVLAFTNTWCEPCKEAAPYLQDLQDEFADRGVMILAMSSWERGDPVNYMKRHGYTYGVMVRGTELARKYNVDNLPTFYVIGVNGQVIYRKEGFKESTAKQMAGVIDRHLKAHGRRADRVPLG